MAMDLLDVSVISAKGYKYILVVCDYFSKYTEAYPLKDKTARSVADALMDIWLPRYGFPMFLHSDMSELLGTVKTKTTPYHPRSDGLVERFNRTLLAMLAMFVSREHDNWDDLLPFMMLAYNTTVHTTTGFTPYRLVFGEKCNLPGNLVHRELCPDPPPGDPGTYASWVRHALHESYDEVRAQQQRATHRQKRNYLSKAVARAFPIGSWALRYYPPAQKNQSEDIVVKTDTVPASTWDLHDAKCILSMKSDCCIDVKGFRFFNMERLFYALQLLTLGDKKYIRQLAKYTRMDYVRKCVNTRFELAPTTLQDKWLDEQFQT